MNKFYLILMIGFCSACSVDVENPNAITKDNFWASEADAEYGINAVYNIFYKPGTYTRWLWFRKDITSDEGFSQSPWAELREWTRFIYNNYNFSEGNAMTYATFYQGIFRANQVLDRVPDIPFENETEKDQLLGQAYFLRGLFYYNLAELWGSENKSVPIVLEPSTPDMQPQGYTETEVYQQAIADFTAAQNLLPEVWNGVEKGRATKGAALAFRAKAHMQLHQWEEARADLYWLVEGEGSGYYDLVAEYADNFTDTHENNIESVFEIQYSDVNPAPAGDGVYDVDPNLGLHRGQFFAPPGIGWNDAELRPWVVDQLKLERDMDGHLDIRLKSTAFYQGMEADFNDNRMIYNLESNNDLWESPNWKGRAFIRKYASGDRGFDDYYNPINVRVVRFADILLMYAECIAESGGSLSDAVEHVDRVRARVKMPPLAQNHFVATTDRGRFLKRLQMERVMELATEGHRWADLKRWGLLDHQAGIDELKQRDADFEHFVIGSHRSLPIPSDEVNNNPNIEQNPGY